MRRAGLLLLAACLARPAAALTIVMQAWNGSDGPYTDVPMDGNTIHQANDDGSGNYAGFQYYRRPSGSFAVGATLYLEVDYKDLGGPGRIGAQYNAVGNDFQQAGMVLGTSVTNSGGYKTGVMRLDNNNFHFGENGANDLRLTKTQNLRMHIKEVRVSDTPTAAYLAATAFMGPYTGPTYVGGTPVDATTFTGKMYVGYQGWFRTPADDDDVGWQHWTRSWGNMAAGLISEDFWPQMDEFSAAEKHAATGYTYPGGAQAELFSSDNARTVLRHFQWMEAYGIDGAALQRFTNGLASPGSDSYRVISHVRAAANQTGRTYYVEYDMTGTPENQLVANIANDWHTLIDSLQLQNDGRYLHDGGLPVVGVFGFFPERFSPATANAILDIFQTGPAQYRAYVAGAGAWYWRTAAETTPAWQTMLYRMKAWQPWNCGNLMGSYPTQYAKYDYWAADKADFNAHGVVYQPELFPGASSANRDGLPPSTPDMPRQGGKFLWDQFVQAYNLGFQTVFLGMFDELDEGTQILKVTENWPTQGGFKAYEGQPSDCYLCYAGLGAKMLKGQIAYTATKPNCPAQTQPSIPDPVSPLNGASLSGGNGSFSWTAALALPGGGGLTRYELWLDGTIVNVGLVLSSVQALAPGNHVWRVRAVNSLGQSGGWSVGQSFTSTGGPSPTRTATPAPAATATPTPSPSATRTAVAVGGCGIQAEDYAAYSDQTAGNQGGQYRADDVDIEATGDAGGGYNVGWTDNGEWLEYLLNVPSSGSYDLTLRVASGQANAGTVQLSVDGSNIGPVLDLPETGAWQTYQDLTLNAQTLASGIHRLRVSVVTGGFNFNYLCVRPAASPTPSATRTASPTGTVSRTPTPSSTRSATPSATGTPTLTAQNSPSGTPTVTLTATRTSSPSATRSVTPSGTPSATASGTPSQTAQNSPSGTPSGTPTATRTSTPSATRSATPSATLSGTPSPSPSASATPTASSSPTRTGSPSQTRTSTASLTASPSSSASASPSPASSGSPTMTLTATRTATSSATPSSSASATPTATQTASRTATASSSPSPTLSASPSGTPSPSPTRSASPSTTVSASPSQSVSPSQSPSVSVSATPVPTGSSATPSPTESPSSTVTGTVTPTPSPTLSGTVTLTGSPSASATASVTGSQTPSATRTATGSVSPSATATATATPSVTRSATASLSATPSLSPSALATQSPSATRTLSATVTVTLTASPTWTPSPQPTGTATVLLTATETSMPTLVPSATPEVRPRVVQVRPYPNPNPHWLSVLVEGPAQQVRVRIFTASRILVGELVQPLGVPGWTKVSLATLSLGPGWWHYQVDLGPGDPGPLKGSFVVLP